MAGVHPLGHRRLALGLKICDAREKTDSRPEKFLLHLPRPVPALVVPCVSQGVDYVPKVGYAQCPSRTLDGITKRSPSAPVGLLDCLHQGRLASKKSDSQRAPAAHPKGVAHTYKAMYAPPAEVPLAVVGIVPCKVTAENGAIARGDLLLTSSRPGYAMKGTDRSRMLGAVIGKTMQPLPKGSGVIQVLVTLQ